MTGGLRRALSLVGLAGGVFLALAYGAFVLWTPRGAFEFAYAPFAPEPLPYAPMRGFTYEQLTNHLARVLLAAPALLLLTFALVRLRPLRSLPASRKLAGAAAVLSLAVTAFVMLFVFRGRATVDDELVYAMQATFYSEGRLGGALGFTPDDVFTIATRAGYTGKYMPLTGILQIPGLVAGIPALIHLPLLGLSFWLWHRQIALRANARFADFATLFLALSPMVMMTSATGLSQAPSLFFLILAGFGLERARSNRPLEGALVAAAALGLGFLVRPQAVLPAGTVIALFLGWTLFRTKSFLALAGFAVVSLAGATLAGLYNVALSGSPFTMPWYLQCSIEQYGFGQVWKLDTYEHTPLRGLENLAVVALRLNAWWLGFPCSLLVLVLWLATGRRAHGTGVWLWVGLAIILFEFAYYSPGVSDTGSAYHYELVLPGALVAAAALEVLLTRAPALAATALAVHAGLGTAPFLVEQTLRLGRLMDAIHADSDRALAEIQPPAVLFYETRASERRLAGWVHDAFPRRFRGTRDPIVTFGTTLPERREAVLSAYPGRRCYYYRRHPETELPELHRCEDARGLMDPTRGDPMARPLWIPPTAYTKSDFDPFAANSARRVRTPSGIPKMSCCGVENVLAGGGAVLPELQATCVEDGP